MAPNTREPKRRPSPAPTDDDRPGPNPIPPGNPQTVGGDDGHGTTVAFIVAFIALVVLGFAVFGCEAPGQMSAGGTVYTPEMGNPTPPPPNAGKEDEPGTGDPSGQSTTDAKTVDLDSGSYVVAFPHVIHAAPSDTVFATFEIEASGSETVEMLVRFRDCDTARVIPQYEQTYERTDGVGFTTPETAPGGPFCAVAAYKVYGPGRVRFGAAIESGEPGRALAGVVFQLADGSDRKRDVFDVRVE